MPWGNPHKQQVATPLRMQNALRKSAQAASRNPFENATECWEMLSDPRMIRSNPGRGWIYRPLGARVTEAANFLAVKISQRFTAYAQGFRGGSVCCSWKRKGRGKRGIRRAWERETESTVCFVVCMDFTLFATSSQLFFSHLKSVPASSHQPASSIFSYNKSALATNYNTANRVLIIIMPGVSLLCLGKE